jgi:hypothetical protein
VEALEMLRELWGKGYSIVDIVLTMFRVVKMMDALPGYTKLGYIKVSQIYFVWFLDIDGRNLGLPI